MQVDATEVQVDATKVQVDATEVQVDAIKVQVDATEVQVDAIKGQIDATEVQVKRFVYTTVTQKAERGVRQYGSVSVKVF